MDQEDFPWTTWPCCPCGGIDPLPHSPLSLSLIILIMLISQSVFLPLSSSAALPANLESHAGGAGAGRPATAAAGDNSA